MHFKLLVQLEKLEVGLFVRRKKCCANIIYLHIIHFNLPLPVGFFRKSFPISLVNTCSLAGLHNVEVLKNTNRLAILFSLFRSNLQNIKINQINGCLYVHNYYS
jgi:hypothetical protein